MPPAPTTWILNFHGVGTPGRALGLGEARVWLPTDRFRAWLDAFPSGSGIRLTFDDGNASDAEEVLPMLLERGLTASFFPCAELLGQPGYLTPAQVRELVEAGMTVGSHGAAHRPWRGLTAAELAVELRDARRRLEDVVGRPVVTAACPFGSYDRRVLEELRREGYERVYTSDGMPAREGAWLVPRLTVRADHEIAQVRALVAERPSAATRLGRALRLAAKRWR